MKLLLTSLIFLAVASCPIEFKKGPGKKRHRPDSTAPASAKPSGVISGNETGLLVSAEWIRKYKALEAKNGAVEADKEIYMEGQHYRIPQAVEDHYSKMRRETPEH